MNLPPEFELRSPISKEDFEEYFRVRYETLRKPWNQPPGSERDKDDETSFHAFILHNNAAIAVGRMHLNDPDHAQIRYMGVDERYRNKGFGGAVVSFLEKKARSLGASSMMLQARDNALPFYLSRGYTIKEKSYVLFDTIQHYRMEKEL